MWGIKSYDVLVGLTDMKGGGHPITEKDLFAREWRQEERKRK